MDKFVLIHQVSETKVQAYIEADPQDNRLLAVYFDNHPHKGKIWTAPDAEGLRKRWEEAGWKRDGASKAAPVFDSKVKPKSKKGA